MASIADELLEKDNYEMIPAHNAPDDDDTSFLAESDAEPQQAEDSDVDEGTQETEVVDPEPEKRYFNPHARTRILEREKARMEDMLRQIWEENQALKASKAQPQAAAEPEPDAEEDPIGFAAHVAKKLEKRMEQEEQQRLAVAQQKQIEEAFRAAQEESMRQIHEFRQQVPSYTHAADYLLTKTMENVKATHPDITPEQMEREIVYWTNQTKMQALMEGRNPAEVFWNAALWAGFDPRSVQRAPKEQIPQQRDAREEIARTRKQSPATLSNVPGSAPRPSRGAADGNSESFDRWLDEGIAKGTLEVRPGTSTPSIADVLPGKVRRK